MRAHLERLFRRARTEYPEGRVEIAWSNERGAVTQAETFAITPEGLDAAAAMALRYNLIARNLYVGVNPRKPTAPPFGRASTTDVEIAFVQFIDGDSEDTAAKLRTAPYTWAVTTGKIPNPRPQAYWDLEEPTRNLTAWSEQQLALANWFGADHVIDPPRIMRLAGTINYPPPRKAAKGYVVEPVTIRTLYDGEERPPISSEALWQLYPTNGHAKPNGHANGHDTSVDEHQPQGRPNFDTGRRDPMEFVAAIQAGHNLHNNARDLIAHLISIGQRDWLIRSYLEALLRPVSDGGTIQQITNLIKTWRQKSDISDEETEDFNNPPGAPELVLSPVGLLDPTRRKPRDWLVPDRMMRRHITMTTAAPGVGKSTLAIEEAISLASGNDFLGLGIKRPHRVAIVNNEETQDELERRIEATCQHFQIPFEAIATTLFVYSGVDAEKIILARADRNGNVTPTIRTQQLRELVNDLQLDLAILDPFVQLHYVEESANDQISQAMVQIRTIGAGGHPAAIHLIHHNRKPVAGSSHQAGDMNAARGASSMGGEAHFFFTLADMAAEDGEQLNIPQNDRANFLRLDDAKRKMSPALGARWFERCGIRMPYGLMGEEVGILIPRDLGDIENKVTVDTATQILHAIDAAWTAGNPYAEHHNTGERYVITMVMMREFALTRQAAKTLLRDWLNSGMVQSEVRNSNTKQRGLRVLKWPG